MLAREKELEVINFNLNQAQILTDRKKQEVSIIKK